MRKGCELSQEIKLLGAPEGQSCRFPLWEAQSDRRPTGTSCVAPSAMGPRKSAGSGARYPPLGSVVLPRLPPSVTTLGKVKGESRTGDGGEVNVKGTPQAQACAPPIRSPSPIPLHQSPFTNPPSPIPLHRTVTELLRRFVDKLCDR